MGYADKVKFELSLLEGVAAGLKALEHSHGCISDEWIDANTEEAKYLKDAGCIDKSQSGMWIVTKMGELLLTATESSADDCPYHDFSTLPAEGDNVIFKDIKAPKDEVSVYMVTFHSDQWLPEVLKDLRWCEVPEYKSSKNERK